MLKKRLRIEWKKDFFKDSPLRPRCEVLMKLRYFTILGNIQLAHNQQIWSNLNIRRCKTQLQTTNFEKKSLREKILRSDFPKTLLW